MGLRLLDDNGMRKELSEREARVRLEQRKAQWADRMTRTITDQVEGRHGLRKCEMSHLQSKSGDGKMMSVSIWGLMFRDKGRSGGDRGDGINRTGMRR
jgi:hypothetical protein